MSYNYDNRLEITSDKLGSASRIPQIRMGTKVSHQYFNNALLKGHYNNTTTHNIQSATKLASNQYAVNNGSDEESLMSYKLRHILSVGAGNTAYFPAERSPTTTGDQKYTESLPLRKYSNLETVHEQDFIVGAENRQTPSININYEMDQISNVESLSTFFDDSNIRTVSETSIIYESSTSAEDVRGNSESYRGEFVAASSSDESDDPELFELREREQIVEKYEKGPDGKDVDPWENPDFELYKITDRFGFVHKSEAELTEENEKERVERELKREQKWLRMLEEWRRRHPEKLPSRIWKGIPDKLRLVFWKRLLNVEEMKASAKPNLYNELLMRARLVSKEVKQIDLDINRTYRDHLAFRRRYDIKQQSLFNVLAAYAMFNTEVGYCQGMSQIAAIFLMYMDEEDAFWCIHCLLANRKYSMHGFFVPGFPKLGRFQNHYEKVIQKYLPKLQKHLDKAGIPNIHLTKWWFGCFLDRVPFSLAIRVWDVFIYFGDCILIAMAYNIMKMHKKTFLKLQMEGFMDFIQQKLAAEFGFSNDHVMESLEECLKRLQSDRMALPPPPNPNDPPEMPTKPLGPILMRSMIDIRMDIAEIHSRSSRANSLAGRSPALKRHHHQKHISTNSDSRRIHPQTAIESISPITPIPPENQEVKTAEINISSSDGSPSLSADTSGRIPSIKKRQNGSRPLKPPPVPDADGFVPMSPRSQPTKEDRGKERVVSYYDNLTTISTSDASNLPNRGSLKERKGILSQLNSNISDMTSASPDLDTHSGDVTIVRAHSSRISRPMTSSSVSVTKLGERQIGTGSLRHKMDGRNLSKVVQMYQEQHKQLQRHLQQCPREEFQSNEVDNSRNEKKEDSKISININDKVDIIKNSSDNRVLEEKLVHRTSDNVTYVSVTNEIKMSKESHMKTQVMPLPYCPPPDYNVEEDDTKDNILQNGEENLNRAPTFKDKIVNTGNVNYSGSSLNQSYSQRPVYLHGTDNYSSGSRYGAEGARIIPGKQFPLQNFSATSAHYPDQRHTKYGRRQMISPTTSQSFVNTSFYDRHPDHVFTEQTPYDAYNNLNRNAFGEHYSQTSASLINRPCAEAQNTFIEPQRVDELPLAYKRPVNEYSSKSFNKEMRHHQN